MNLRTVAGWAYVCHMSEYSPEPTPAHDAERWKAQDVRRLAVATLLSERTVYRWLQAPERTTPGNRRRLEAARAKLQIKTGPEA